jgi:SAM-dependent methyltransferase
MRKGWFKIDGVQDGDRTIAEQLKGLEPLLEEITRGVRIWNGVRAPSVLDLGCAEGLISKACVAAGAERVMGLDGNPEFIKLAYRLGLDIHRASFAVKDLNDSPDYSYDSDIVLMLAILHKLRDPGKMLRDWSPFAGRLILVRLPPATAPVIIDKRSNNIPCDVQAILEELGFDLEQVTRGHFDEWCGYFRRA